MKLRVFTPLMGALMLSSSLALACDLCSIVNSSAMRGVNSGSFRFGISEQFTSFNRLQVGGHKADNIDHQHYQSSITQAVASYDLTDRVGLQVNLPFINRRVKRMGAAGVENFTESGIGDVSILGRWEALDIDKGDRSLSLQLFGGLKLPTGDSARLKEEVGHSHTASLNARHNGEDHSMDQLEVTSDHSDEMSDHELVDEHIDSHEDHSDVHHDESDMPHVTSISHGAIHGHDIALGSGSLDVPLGMSLFMRQDRFFLGGFAQYTVRSEGDYDYRYANDLIVSGGPGVYLSTLHDMTISARAVLTGEWKSYDSGPNGKQLDTARRAIYAGPELVVTSDSNLLFDLGLDMPLDVNNSGTQVVQSYRIRSGLTYRF